MKNKLFIINDCHLGVSRSGGTTKESAAALGDWQRDYFQDLLNKAAGHDLLINGDLFDKFEVSKQVEFDTYIQLVGWLDTHPTHKLILSAGNHDLSTNSERRSSFENLCAYLSVGYGQQVEIVRTGVCSFDKFTVVPHMPNQELFDAELEKALASGQPYCFVHANLMSPFAVHSDHSLNVDETMLKKFADAGITMVFAHEHNARRLANAVVVGNQIPASVSDCLDSNLTKQYAVLGTDGLSTQDFVRLADVYTEVDWQSEAVPDKRFIRVTGTANYEQASEVVQRISDIRRQSSAFVVANAVKVGTLDAVAPTEDLQAFNIQDLVAAGLPADLVDRFNDVVKCV